MPLNRFYCAICGSALTAPDSSQRHLVECPQCQHVVPSPAAIDGSHLISEDGSWVFPKGVIRLDLIFLCASCEVSLQIDARWEGRNVPCPKCQQPLSVPRWSRKTRPAVNLTAEEIDFLSEPVAAAF